LTLLLPKEQRAGIENRMQAAGIAVPEFTDGIMGSVSVSRGLTQDYDGNSVEIMFLNDAVPNSDFGRMQIGLGVSNMAAMGAFLQQVLALEPVTTEGSMHVYEMGKTQVKFWQLPATSPAWVGRPHEMLGMAMFQFVVDDVVAARDLIVARGGKILVEPYVLGDLAIIMFVEGPDGVLVEFGAVLVK
jgi:catechol 2,3-dioxygenase-like lactoylglutathione lyase family enzyme